MAMIDPIQQMKESRLVGVPEYNWVPKIWENKTAAPPTLDDTAKAEPPLSTSKLKCDRKPEAFPGEDTPVDPAQGEEDKFKHGFKMWVHPDSNFDHTDPPLWNDTDLKTARGSNLPKDQFIKLKKLVGRESLGMQRLSNIFEWTLCQTHHFLTEVNEGLGKGPTNFTPDYTRYTNARNNYIKFLRDLEDHEPGLRQKPNPKDPDFEIRPGHIQPAVPGSSGYGRAVKWLYIYPLIVSGRIVGAKVSIQWNPHSSSNGIPIPHNP